MSSVLPEKQSELLEYLLNHASVWGSAPPAAIGLTAAQITQLESYLEVSKTKYDELLALRQQVKASTMGNNQSMSELRSYAGGLINAIRSYATTTSNENVYVLAQIPPRKDPSSVPPPGKPIDMTVGLNPDGSLTLKWKSTNSASSNGGYFEVSRRLAGQAGFSVIGGGGTREFLDGTIPTGSTLVSYIITPRRGTKVGTPSDQFNVQFGVGVGGPTVTGFTERSAPRIAA